MGGANESFATTQWTKVLSAASSDPARQREALAILVERYWKPVYCFLRRKGNSNEKAKDLTQGFFAEVVLGRDLVRQADRGRGKFRTFLLGALEHYVIDIHRYDSAQRRMPPGGLAALAAIDPKRVSVTAHATTAQGAFQYAWAKQLVGDALAELKAEYRAGGKEAYWQVFHARVVRPLLENEPPGPLPDLCGRLGIETQQKASNMIATAKRRFRSILRRRVGESLDCDDETDEEIAELMRILTAGGARS